MWDDIRNLCMLCAREKQEKEKLHFCCRLNFLSTSFHLEPISSHFLVNVCLQYLTLDLSSIIQFFYPKLSRKDWNFFVIFFRRLLLKKWDLDVSIWHKRLLTYVLLNFQYIHMRCALRTQLLYALNYSGGRCRQMYTNSHL